MFCNYKTGFLSVALLLLSSYMGGRADTMPLGYCNTAENPTGSLSDNTADAWTSGAVFIPASTAATISGKQITDIRFGIQLMLNVESAKVWIRTDLDGENQVEQTIDASSVPALARGWNEVSLSTPWTVPADCKGFYIGYSILQKGYCYGLANSPVACTNGLFVNLGDKGWQDMSDSGTLYLQATVQGDNLPGVNVGVASCNIADRYNMSDSQLAATIIVHNLGTEAVSAFDVSLLSDDGQQLASTHVDTELLPGTSREYALDFAPTFTQAGQYDLTLRVDNIAEGADVDMLDNVSAPQRVNVMGSKLQRVVLVEEFTTEKCPNCPRAANTLSSLLHNDKYEGRVVAVAHHTGYYYDAFTKPCDYEYEWFFNGNLSAPQMMVDRYAKNNSSPVMSDSQLEAAVAERINVEPVMTLNLEAGFDEADDTRLRVVAKGVKYSREDPVASPHITIWLTENNVKPAAGQQGASANFKHQHVTRALNSTWGNPISFDGDQFEYVYTFENVDKDWKREDLEVVAAVHGEKTENFSSVEIANAAAIGYDKFTAIPSGVSEITDIEQGEAVYYTLSGVRVNQQNLAPGIYVRMQGNKAVKVVIK